MQGLTAGARHNFERGGAQVHILPFERNHLAHSKSDVRAEQHYIPRVLGGQGLSE
jgi:hypothetical protein